MSLTQRLLSAANHTYAINADGEVGPYGGTPLAPSSRFVGWTARPRGVAAGTALQDGAMVGVIPEGVVVAIRGTTGVMNPDQRRVILDWANDGLAPLCQRPGFPGQVHAGFHLSFANLWPELGPLVKQAAAANPGKPIYVTGHSKGGAIAPLVAWRLHKDYPTRPLVVRTFAAARSTDAGFTAAYNAAIPDHIRYEFANDIVPHVPLRNVLLATLGIPEWLLDQLAPASAGYASPGKLGYIRTDHAIVADSPALESQRIAALLAVLQSGAFSTIVDSHLLDAGKGYCSAAYP